MSIGFSVLPLNLPSFQACRRSWPYRDHARNRPRSCWGLAGFCRDHPRNRSADRGADREADQVPDQARDRATHGITVSTADLARSIGLSAPPDHIAAQANRRSGPQAAGTVSKDVGRERRGQKVVWAKVVWAETWTTRGSTRLNARPNTLHNPVRSAKILM